MTKKLYRYFEDYGRMGDIEGLLILTDEEYQKLCEHTSELYWFELLGKHSEGTFDFAEYCDVVGDIDSKTLQILESNLGKVISGPFDLDYMLECVNEVEDDCD